ncbi:uncharacterized protein V1518DRAFT_259917 [Limtongia smithiae]|uniref:uncharacterized protein n=1 Tax=Limtongia smithiae TaxID=1125753 RepID=UPI0034CECD2B
MEALPTFMVYLPDKPEALGSRAAKASQHAAHIKELIDSGVLALGGPFFPDGTDITATTLPSAVGSLLIVRAKTAEEVWTTLREDAFADLWDFSKAVVLPVSCDMYIIILVQAAKTSRSS